MSEVLVKVKGVPPSLEKKFGRAVDRVVDEMVDRARESMALEILGKSRLTEEQARELGEEVKEGIAKRHGL